MDLTPHPTQGLNFILWSQQMKNNNIFYKRYQEIMNKEQNKNEDCLLYTSPSPRD